MSNVSKEVLDLSAKIQEAVKIDHKTGTAEVADGIWESTLPDTLTKEQVKQVKDHEANFVAAGGHAVGRLAIVAMKKNKDLNEVQATIGMHGYDKAVYSVERERQYHNPQDKDADPIVKHGVLGVNFRNMAGRNAGELKKVMKEISEEAAKALNK